MDPCSSNLLVWALTGVVSFSQPTNKLLVSVREDNYLHEIDLKTLKETNKFNMNAKTWDDHVRLDQNLSLMTSCRLCHAALLSST